MNTITLKVVRVPGAVSEVVLESPATVGDALAAAGVSSDAGESVTMNGNTVSNDAPVSDGGRIIVAKGAKGNG